MTVLGIESSCDETSAAVYTDQGLLSNIVSSQTVHSKFGGIIPEMASRAHVEHISRVVRTALEEANCKMSNVDAVAVTTHPGLHGSLIVGSNFAKGLALSHNIPAIPVNHIEGHLYSPFLEFDDITLPMIALVVSGGHTSLFHVESTDAYEVVGNTRDDAAGEAFDKVAKMLGLGYPGGIVIDTLGQKGNPQAFSFPRGMIRDRNLDFSFSGLKTAVRVFLAEHYPQGVPEQDLPDICASVMEAIAEVLVVKTMKAAKKRGVRTIAVSGGVSANSRVRSFFHEAAERKNVRVVFPSLEYCTDNAAMIAWIGHTKAQQSLEKDLSFVTGAAALRSDGKKAKRKTRG